MSTPTNQINLIHTPDQIHFCVNKHNLSIMQEISSIITNPSYSAFKLKSSKKGKYYVSNSPQTDHVFERLQNFPGISPMLLEHKFFKLSQSVKALHKAYSKLGYELDRPINHLYLHNEQYINDILPTVNSFVNELKRDSTTRIAMADRLQRLELINELKKENARVMKKLFKTQQRFNLNIFTYVFDMNKCDSRDKSFIEQGLTQQISVMIDKFHDKYQSEILDLFFRVQRDLSNNYVLTVYSATERECKPLSMKDFIPLRNEKHLIIAPNTNIILTTHEVDYPMDIQGVEGTNEKTWKAIFGEILFNYNYLYYETEYVSPKFIYRKCDSNH
ncbi:hypothetical protein J809_2339 [Acinetobacter sp. 25977_6]|nr:hypothetical protein J811_3746 [Acinetobacter sp. 25977_8]EXT40049.1 hypothetical protein J810_3726 [Acinetobacter sp. 25977_7]EXT44357.1 hypothetical protein J809_2339 [Acinetobacter sp. 25977_6]EXT50466.1 hypothetical protein J806_3910 [Acinetobacter sp. 25977_3]EXT53067.1 hypothetical protein J805_3766 [Acinetobacter sp. 25977_2]EXT56855.1 hypothetical protein J804_3886 [Acinetobacter sp. 25977_1]EXT65312.1 hypothetical protein J813_3719 [Acinetobacter sp. 25977_10]KCX38167.1 hypotheti